MSDHSHPLILTAHLCRIRLMVTDGKLWPLYWLFYLLIDLFGISCVLNDRCFHPRNAAYGSFVVRLSTIKSAISVISKRVEMRKVMRSYVTTAWIVAVLLLSRPSCAQFDASECGTKKVFCWIDYTICMLQVVETNARAFTSFPFDNQSTLLSISINKYLNYIVQDCREIALNNSSIWISINFKVWRENWSKAYRGLPENQLPYLHRMEYSDILIFSSFREEENL